MERILSSNKNVIQKENSQFQNRYAISIRPKKKGQEARITLKISGGGVNPRITGYGSSINESVLKLICNIKLKLMEYKELNLINQKNILEIQDLLSSSIKVLKINDEKIFFEIASIFNILTEPREVVNSFISSQSNDNSINEAAIVDNKLKPIKSVDFRSVALEWFRDKLSLTKETVENPNPLSPRTVDGYYQVLDRQLIPYFKSNKNISIITQEDCKKCVLSFNGARNKESVYFVLKMIFDYAKSKKYIFYVPEIFKPQKPKKREEKEIIYIDPDKQTDWLDKFEKVSTDMTILFETLLLEGLRPEERLWFKMGKY